MHRTDGPCVGQGWFDDSRGRVHSLARSLARGGRARDLPLVRLAWRVGFPRRGEDEAASSRCFGRRRAPKRSIPIISSIQILIPIHPMPRSDHSAPSASASTAGPSAPGPPPPGSSSTDVAHTAHSAHGTPGQPKPKRTSACLHCRRQKLKVRSPAYLLAQLLHCFALTQSATAGQTSPARGESCGGPRVSPVVGPPSRCTPAHARPSRPQSRLTPDAATTGSSASCGRARTPRFSWTT